MSAAAARGTALGVIRPSTELGQSAAAPAGGGAVTHRLGSLDLPLREPLRWLQPGQDPVTALESGPLSLHGGGAADARPSEGTPAPGPECRDLQTIPDEYIYVELPPEARARMEAGGYQFQVCLMFCATCAPAFALLPRSNTRLTPCGGPFPGHGHRHATARVGGRHAACGCVPFTSRTAPLSGVR